MDDSLFSRLPRVIRERIYELSFLSSTKATLCMEGSQLRLQLPPQRKNVLALLKTCKQIHIEASNVFYNKATFVIPILAFEHVRLRNDSKRRPTTYDQTSHDPVLAAILRKWTISIHNWLQRIGPINRSHLLKVDLAMGNWHFLKPEHYDLQIALSLHALLKTTFFPQNPSLQLTLTLTITLPTPPLSPNPCLITLHLPLPHLALHTLVLQQIFSDRVRLFHALYYQRRLSLAMFESLRRANLGCRWRLEGLVEGVCLGRRRVDDGTEETGGVVKRDTLELESLLMGIREGRRKAAIGPEQDDDEGNWEERAMGAIERVSLVKKTKKRVEMTMGSLAKGVGEELVTPTSGSTTLQSTHTDVDAGPGLRQPPPTKEANGKTKVQGGLAFLEKMVGLVRKHRMSAGRMYTRA